MASNPQGNRAPVSQQRLEILPDADSLAKRVADWLLDAAKSSDGLFTVALSGGSTPRALYELLAEPPYRDAFPWARTHFFWGDERFVPHDDARSNFRMAREALLSRVPIPAENIHPVPTQGFGPEAAAAAYQRELMTFYGAETLDPGRPLFDVTLLGLGADGHTASLFPGGAALAERRLWVAAVTDAKGLARITLTYPAIDSSSRVAFLVAGKEKSAIFSRLRRGDGALPAAHVHPVGELWQFV
ncbi:6-phosphogluconolactonase, partial [Rhodoblastus sp.]|uniref:6-phosphogluconolactonase n=1 Tax=Rhodoblastus sp. TaxID=1962975 RepID=UPI003F9BD1E0